MSSANPYDGLCSLQRLLALHAAGVSAHGGTSGVRDPHCPGGTLGAAWQAEEYNAKPDAVQGLMFAVYLVYYFASKQCFVDGNKRLSWMAMSEVLACMGLEVDATDDEATQLVLDIANRKFRDVEPVYLWVIERLREIQPRVQFSQVVRSAPDGQPQQ